MHHVVQESGLSSVPLDQGVVGVCLCQQQELQDGFGGSPRPRVRAYRQQEQERDM
jgi:hypothetical protein